MRHTPIHNALARIKRKQLILHLKSQILAFESMSLCTSYMGGFIAITVGKDAIHSLTNSIFEQFTGNLTHEIASIRGGLDDSLDNLAQYEGGLDTAISAVDTATNSIQTSPKPAPVPKTFAEARKVAEKMAVRNFNDAKSKKTLHESQAPIPRRPQI